MDPNEIITQYYIRPGATYFSPVAQIRTEKAQSGVPFWMQPFPLMTCEVMRIDVPDPYQKNINFKHVEGWHNSGYIGTGSAPTQGIYTGVE